MLRDIETKQFFFPFQQLLAGDLINLLVDLESKGGIIFLNITKQTHHATIFGGPFAFAVLHGTIYTRKQHVAFIGQQTIKRTSLDKSFKCTLANEARIDAGTEIAKRSKGTTFS